MSLNPNNLARALIFAGIVAYVRPFDFGMRKSKLQPKEFDDIWNGDAKSLHSYLYDLRQKHIAHSVNDCERSDAVGVIIINAGHERLADSASGIGVTILNSIGLTKSKLDQAIPHVSVMITHVSGRIEKLRRQLHAEMKSSLDSGDRWVMAPLVRFPEVKKVGQRRP